MRARNDKRTPNDAATKAWLVFAPWIATGVIGIAWYAFTPATPKDIRPAPVIPMPDPERPMFTDVSMESGLDGRSVDWELMEGCEEACMAKVMGGGAAAGDYDGDGDMDLVLTRIGKPATLYRNDGGMFEDATDEAGLAGIINANGALWADVDNDGDQDLYLTAIGERRYRLFINREGRFRDEAVRRGAALDDGEIHQGFSVAAGDYDRDGWTDLMVGEWGYDLVTSHTRLLRNRGAGAPGHFEDVTEKAGFLTRNLETWGALGSMEGARRETQRRLHRLLADETKRAAVLEALESPAVKKVAGEYLRYSGQFAFSPAFVDLDDDGWQDLAIAADFGTSRIFWNRRDGTFEDGTLAAAVGSDENGMGSTFGDVDADGRLDWFVTSISHPSGTCYDPLSREDCLGQSGNRLYRNLGGRKFEDATDRFGVRHGYWGWGAAFFDHDNDGDLDLAMTNGMHAKSRFADDPMRFWENMDGKMREISGLLGLTDIRSGKGLLTFDHDGDGDIDLLVVNDDAPPRLYRNDGGNKKGWLKVRLVGTRSNRDAFGARVTVTAAPGAPAQVREVGAATHFLGQSERTLHFGLGDGDGPVAEVRVDWPRTGRTQIITDVARNGTLVIEEE